MATVFFSWQADRSTGVCRNVIERALEAALNRLKADIDVETPDRGSLELDRDTRNVSGIPAIFETIMAKIKSASVFVADLTFIGARVDGRPTSNPNVLIEYGFALAEVGWQRMLAVMNDSFGKPSDGNMPFNLAHARFPIAYSLRDDSSQEERTIVQRKLAKAFEAALRDIFQNEEFKERAEKNQSALDIAAAYRSLINFEEAKAELRTRDGIRRVRQAIEALFTLIEKRCNDLNTREEMGIECGSKIDSYEHWPACIIRFGSVLGVIVRWESRNVQSIDGAELRVEVWDGRLLLPGEPHPRVRIHNPERISVVCYEPTVSRQDFAELGWQDNYRKDAPFLRSEDLADECLRALVIAVYNAHKRD